MKTALKCKIINMKRKIEKSLNKIKEEQHPNHLGHLSGENDIKKSIYIQKLAKLNKNK